jgi:flagellar protein FliO/FliZ
MSGVVAEQLPLLRTGLALAAVLLLAMGLAWALRRYGGGSLPGLRQPGRLRLVATQVVDARTRIVLIQRDGCEHLLAVGAAGVTLIESFAAPASGVGQEERA